jgi:hypothetical protein
VAIAVTSLVYGLGTFLVARSVVRARRKVSVPLTAGWIIVAFSVLLIACAGCSSTEGILKAQYPCEASTDFRHSFVQVGATDAATGKPLRGVKVDLDPYGLEKLTNSAGFVCFGNLRVPSTGNTPCILIALTLAKSGYGTFKMSNQLLNAQGSFRTVVPLSSSPVNQVHPRPKECATSP